MLKSALINLDSLSLSLSLSLAQRWGSKDRLDKDTDSDTGISNGLEASKVWQVSISRFLLIPVPLTPSSHLLFCLSLPLSLLFPRLTFPSLSPSPCPSYILVSPFLLSPSSPQEKFSDVEQKYKEAMVSSAQLYNEKTALVYQVESLKDRSAASKLPTHWHQNKT